MPKKTEPTPIVYESRTKARAEMLAAGRDISGGYEYNIVTHADPVERAKNLASQKETTDSWSFVCPNGTGGILTPIVARWYMGRSASASVVYCSIWIYPPTGSRFGWAGAGAENPEAWSAGCSGHGSAGGGGYHKQSAALGDAIRAAGLILEHNIDGRGDGASRNAIWAIADMLGVSFDGAGIVEA